MVDLYASVTVAKCPAQSSNWKYLFGGEYRTPAVSGERIADKDCRAIGSAYAHGGRQTAGGREGEEEEAENTNVQWRVYRSQKSGRDRG